MMGDRLLLVVEGRDDERVISAIRDHHAFSPKFEIEAQGGYEKLRNGIGIRLKAGTELKRLGIVVDADTEILSRWESIKGVLVKAGYQDVPDLPDPKGTIVEHDILPRVGVWIMPDNTVPGMLEDYMTFLIPENDGLLEYARKSMNEIPLADRRFSEIHQSKALIHTWLAWQETPGIPLGQAITRRFFDADRPAVVDFLNWLTRLFA
jgi:hypothetical protein